MRRGGPAGAVRTRPRGARTGTRPGGARIFHAVKLTLPPEWTDADDIKRYLRAEFDRYELVRDD